jgi:hypothetical protein
MYKSKYSEPLSESLLEAIETTSQENNEALGITGILIGNRSSFMQVLEGEAEAVNEIFNTICKDERHTKIELVGYEIIAQRAFADWSMKCIAVGLLGRILAQRLKQKYGEENADLKLPSDSDEAFALLYDVAFLLRQDEID